MSGNDLEARYRHALATICQVVGGTHAHDEIPQKGADFIRKVCREAMPDHPIWVKRARQASKAKSGITPFLEGLDEIE
jgi:hypothetical protein